MKYFPYIFCTVLFLVFIEWANAQAYAYTKAEVYLLKDDFTNVKKIDDASYFLHIVKHSDTQYVCRYYNTFGPMLKQETFLDSGLSIPNGSFLWYDAKGILDSIAEVYRGRKTSFTVFDDSLKTTVYIEYRNGAVYEKRDHITNIYTDSTGNTYNLAEKEKEEGDRLLQWKRPQADTNQTEAIFPGNWNKYLDRHLLVPDRFSQSFPVGKYHATVSFRVTKEGKLDEVTILRSLEWSVDLEIFQTYDDSPLWKPAVQCGQNVIYRQRHNLEFRISESF